MLKRIDYSVIKVSGEDENFPAAELNNQRPSAKGWMSPKDIYFSENAFTEYKARELRTAYIDIIGKFVKLVLHQNHINKLNLCNQVGIVAINIIGETILDGGSIKAKYLSDDHLLNLRTKKSELEELSFTMYIDLEVQQLIKTLDKKKQKAVLDDRFVYAKKLKYAINQLMKVGEKLGKLDILKEKAVEEEDYDQAHIKNEEMEKLRLQTYERMNITTLMEIDGQVLEENDRDFIGKGSAKPPDEILAPMVGNYVSVEEKPVQALKKAKTQPSVFPGTDAETLGDSPLGKLTEKERREASLPIEVFGIELVEKMYSKAFKQREESMKNISAYLEKYQKKGKSHAPNEVIRAVSILIQRAFFDNVHSIYAAALNILTECFKHFIPQNQVSKSETNFLVDKCIPEIMNKLGDTASRLKNASMEYLIENVRYLEENSQFIQQYAVTPIQNVLNVRLAQGRCELIEKIVKKYPPWNFNILPLSRVMPFLLDALHHPSSSVRSIAERIILYLYDHEVIKVKKYFSFDSDTLKKNIMYRRLQQAFDKKKRNSKEKNGMVQMNNSNQKTLEELSLMKTCIFCEERSDRFTASGLDEHYDKECPMLIRCSNCKQILEIATLTEHLLEECGSKNQYKQCPICLEAVPSLNFENHVKIRTCTMAKPENEANHCPLCHKNIAPGEGGWRSHFLTTPGCAFNSRIKKNNSRKSILRKKSEKTS
ncbi:centrosomal protein of 104 kDa-like isoform X3 [Stegodyphus dumicola]|uniref:centrosomal protein of 104 kDa-like isoform X3 n=1 Tax=Stegodyphus dumicola TaxID=202533 RepID=UPI0015B0DD32|nr:centrosomal protein of 104 kDa-like isoform X3 [Stegodyphus dumicola]